MTPKEIAEKHMANWMADPEDDTLDGHVEAACTEAYREGMMMVLEKFQRCSKEIIAEIRAASEKEKPDAE